MRFRLHRIGQPCSEEIVIRMNRTNGSGVRVVASAVAEKGGSVGPVPNAQPRAVPRILILGAGFGGLECARRLEHRLSSKEAEIVEDD